MINAKLRRLVRQSGEIMALYQEHNEDETFKVSPYMNKEVKGSEVVTITFTQGTSLEWQFLEPLAKLCIAKKINWSIRSGEDDEGDLSLDIS